MLCGHVFLGSTMRPSCIWHPVIPQRVCERHHRGKGVIHGIKLVVWRHPCHRHPLTMPTLRQARRDLRPGLLQLRFVEARTETPELNRRSYDEVSELVGILSHGQLLASGWWLWHPGPSSVAPLLRELEVTRAGLEVLALLQFGRQLASARLVSRLTWKLLLLGRREWSLRLLFRVSGGSCVGSKRDCTFVSPLAVAAVDDMLICARLLVDRWSAKAVLPMHICSLLPVLRFLIYPGMFLVAWFCIYGECMMRY